ncbi:jasmonate-induced oxygenase 2-like isoform X2 [Tasmannia lanceolata]|uniref:jasmonate-induced oxygenase 2-like isoform X2 n=1 Tax=Tasmannia lanceolata TaxID=3420 RepID=UPI004062A092
MDSLQEWPEPIIRVQSLSDSGITAIPNRYVKPLIDRPTVGLLSGFNIPIIDLGGLDGNETVRQMSGACREWGFFQVINHGVSPELIRKTREVWKEFFHLPIEQRDVIEEYGQQLVKLGGNIMKMLSKGLGLEEGYLQNAFGGEDIGACLRVNFYPKCPQPDLTLGLSSHSDPGGLTILLPDDYVDGLQVRKDDAWVTVQPSPDAFIVNIGDQIQVLSNMEYKSIEHRVIVNSIQERLSLACFYNPKSDIPIGPIPELVTPDQPTLYRPMTFNEYRLFIRHQGPRGKSQVESLASRRAASVIQHS